MKGLLPKLYEYLKMMWVLMPALFTKPVQQKKSFNNAFGPNKRFLAIGFDDFRISDFSTIIPLFEKYGFRATFNKITNNDELTRFEKLLIRRVLIGGHEVGDHTILHTKYIFDEPLFNGQNPNSPEGNQIAYPSDDQFRDDRGDGKNVFGIPLNQTIAETYRIRDWCPSIDPEITWGGQAV